MRVSVRISAITLWLGIVATACLGTTTSPLAIEVAPGPNPWTHLELRNNPDDFQFAILADRNGGGRHDVFREALRKVNLMQPEFVMCVGDLIPGYTANPEAIRAQWDEVMADLKDLHAPFFHVPGNHDMSNQVEIAEWMKRFGRSYYHFVYRNVLFLVLDGELPPGKRLSREQIEYFRDAIAKNPASRWTFVFLHGPLWEPHYNQQARQQGQSTLWNEFEELLSGRNYSVFAGHTHHYALHERKGQKYHVLATTGGGSALRGARSYGETDHVTWVTMTDKGPIVANLELAGIHDDALRTAQEANMAEAVLARGVQPQAVVVAPGQKDLVRTKLLLRNDAPEPMQVRVAFDRANRFRTTPAVIETTVPAKSQTTAPLTIRTAGVKDAAAVGPIMFDWRARYDLPGRKPLEVGGRKAIGIETYHDCGRRATTPTIDGRLDDWKRLPLTDPVTAQFGNARRHRAARLDTSFEFATQYDAQYVYVAVRVNDEKVQTDAKRMPWEQDGVEIRLDARPDPERSESMGGDENVTSLFMAVNPPENGGEPAVFEREKLPAGTLVASRRTKHGYTVEAAVPTAYLDQAQGGTWKAFRLNVAVNDCDKPNFKDRVQTWWRPDWRGQQNYAGSGTFTRAARHAAPRGRL